MKETNKITRICCISWILCICSYLCTILIRSYMYSTMMINNQIEESIIQRIDFLDTLIQLIYDVFIILMFSTFLYLIERFLHASLKKDCYFTGLTLITCMLLSLLSVILFEIPKTTAFAPFQLFPHFFFFLAILAIMNVLRKRYDAIHTHNFT